MPAKTFLENILFLLKKAPGKRMNDRIGLTTNMIKVQDNVQLLILALRKFRNP